MTISPSDLLCEFVGLFDGEDQYTAAIIMCDGLPVHVVKQPEFMTAYMDEPIEDVFGVMCLEFPNFFLEAGVSIEDANEFIKYFKLQS